ncbi:HAD-IA family hydrolase [Psychrobium sp. 1_MG-2023]|uniref:HAD-IA family hydrolase n=1 Tax=Psychrobium sp. 1_MG-2023 TaxID=3062624 RepID=UPI000C338393|nr:HAD-IA family hydrolase [Psychrobium sp. 1_MG-2023]MDP2562006.1 HAD-IA family hydrolase [Psychrobium sp. 1_MG-2023]PKF58614.1 hypothetical protein CW748_02985 [Alteromonadales bacterium alter-6D02]
MSFNLKPHSANALAFAQCNYLTMHFYKTYQRPLAIGFDLDDTLYDNQPVLAHAEQQLQQYLLQQFPKTKKLTLNDWLQLRLTAVVHQPSLAHDISLSRRVSIEQGLLSLGYSVDEAVMGSQRALSVFLQWRNKITITPNTLNTLTELGRQFRLFVISNGNADIHKLGLGHLFEFALHPNQHCPMKPAQCLFTQAQQRLALPQQSILYIGDHPISDIVGANNAGWQSGWYNPTQQLIQHRKGSLQLPTFELSTITQLKQLLK